ncbi:MAG TPA: anaerobic ribonucleoside-triphosphate reductase activating protein [Deltaproteobacteria bacterium]|nr:anaerobic ribonucleoside-triphosphate reductase activating protein [Deltaproteobacteria bacterium]
MKIGGLQKVSLIDYPCAICAVVFTQGCNFKCGYCHNPELVDPERFGQCIDEKYFMEFLSTRVGKLDAVSITGGEPTIQKDLIGFIKKIKKMGFAVKIDTNGSQPQVLKDLLKNKLLDFIAIDIKAPLAKYKGITRAFVDTELIRESIGAILKAKIPQEFRTTLVRSQLNADDIREIARMINGAKRYVLQKFMPTKTLDKKFISENTWPDKDLQAIKKDLEKKITSVIVR